MKRILLKLSGESLSENNGYGINAEKLSYYADEIGSAVSSGCQIAVVLGGGNIFRGVQGAKKGFDRIQGDYMGMMATIINSIALKSELLERNIKAVLLSGIVVEGITEKMTSQKASQYLGDGYVVIIAGGTGNPFFTTDSAGALRALEIKADILLKGTRVDGVYDKDPEKFPNAVKYEKVTFDEAIEKHLKIMDETAFTLCKENKMPIIVFNINEKGSLKKIIEGQNVGTIINNN